MGVIIVILYIICGGLLLWQGVASLGVASWCTRLFIPALNKNVFCVAAGGFISRFGIVLGVVSLGLALLYATDSQSKETGLRNRGSYLLMLICMVAFSLATLL